MIDRGSWMQTQSGKRFYPLDPRPEDLDIQDIAHALAMQCRYAGHTSRFYSVAEHCVHVARSLPRELRLAGLLHDASEAYLVDVPRPVKAMLKDYTLMEDLLMGAIARKFGFCWPLAREVHYADEDILNDELAQCMKGVQAGPWNLSGKSLGVRIQFWDHVEAKWEFLNLFDQLIAGGAVLCNSTTPS